jgi:nucleotide-binding universal stress UspA family protein
MARHILVTLDTYGRSARVLARVCLLARHCRSTVSLLMVAALEREPVLAAPATCTAVPTDTPVHQYLHEVAMFLQQQGIDVHTLVRCGEPVETILTVAREVGADLIAMTMPWRTGDALLDAKNITEQVIRKAPLPVLVERPHVGAMKPKRSGQCSLKI